MTEPIGSLDVPGGKLPLQAMSIKTQITGLLYATTLSQTYVNNHQQPLEATYIFPLPSRAAVAGYAMKIGQEVVEGQLRPRAQARQQYEQAVTAGLRASTAEQERPDVFSLRVGNLAPGEEMTVELRLEGPLALEGSQACFRFPLVVGPRYIPGQALDGPQAGPGTQLDSHLVPDASRISPPILLAGHPNPVRLEIEVDVDPAGLALHSLATSLHEVSISRRGDGYKLVLGPAERLNRDFILRLDLLPVTSLLVDADQSFLLTVVPPPAPADRPGRDVVIMIDSSGSMRGWKMTAARRAAAAMVESLTPRDRFGLFVFGSRPVDGPYAQLHPAYDQAKADTVKFLAGVEAGGGTEMRLALRHAEGYLSKMGPDQSLVLITDGEVGDQDSLMAWQAAHPQLRIFVVGIDQSPSQGLMDRLATQSGGLCRMVENEARLAPALQELHRAVGMPVLQHLEMLPAASLVSPERWDVFPGHPALFHGKLANLETVQLRAMLPNGEVWSESVTPRRVETKVVTRAWARARMLGMEDHWSAHGNNEQQIVQFSLEQGVLSRFTAFLAIDQRTPAVQGELHRVVQPVEPVAGREEFRKRESRKPESVVQLMQVDPLSLEVGRGLLPLVDPNQGAKLLLEGVTSLRRRVALKTGLVVPGVRFRDNLQLAPYAYVIKLKEVEIFRAQLPSAGPENVDLVLAELEKLVLAHAAELLGRQELQALVDTLKKSHPELVKSLVPDRFSLGNLLLIFRDLLNERVWIRDLVGIFQVLVDHPGESDPKVLVEQIRRSRAEFICQDLLQDDEQIPALVVDRVLPLPELNQLIRQHQPRVLVTPPSLRREVRAQIAREYPVLAVLSREEVRDRLTASLEGQIAMLELRRNAAPTQSSSS